MISIQDLIFIIESCISYYPYISRSDINIDITKIWPGWTITDRLGRGGFGHVYKATYAETDAVTAVKVISIPDNNNVIEGGRSDDEILSLSMKKPST